MLLLCLSQFHIHYVQVVVLFMTVPLTKSLYSTQELYGIPLLVFCQKLCTFNYLLYVKIVLHVNNCHVLTQIVSNFTQKAYN